ncbi:MAG: rRNA maturation RNase YbeY [Tunicatimonas sp.]|uniref:rRNA maturation RNase YbeY n=1 Tax=Tunicatimonas sp. TaxID=1940096 RepID=UPI003C70CCBB
MIQFFVEDTNFVPHPLLSSVTNWLLKVVTFYNHSIKEINYIFCSDEYLLTINQQFLSHDFFTDIITFDNRDQSSQPLESDIFISVDRVKENSQQLNTSFLHELLRVIVHGILHLLEFNDSDDIEKSEMRTLESKFVDMYFQEFHSS